MRQLFAFNYSSVALLAVPFLIAGASAHAGTSINTGSLGAAANGTDSDTVTFGPGAVTAGGDKSAVYNGVTGTNTTVPFQSQLNPAVASPFSIEFWSNPTASDN